MNTRSFIKSLLAIGAAPMILVPKLADAYQWKSGVITRERVRYYGQLWEKDKSGLFHPVQEKPRTWDDVLAAQGRKFDSA